MTAAASIGRSVAWRAPRCSRVPPVKLETPQSSFLGVVWRREGRLPH